MTPALEQKEYWGLYWLGRTPILCGLQLKYGTVSLIASAEGEEAIALAQSQGLAFKGVYCSSNQLPHLWLPLTQSTVSEEAALQSELRKTIPPG